MRSTKKIENIGENFSGAFSKNTFENTYSMESKNEPPENIGRQKFETTVQKNKDAVLSVLNQVPKNIQIAFK